MSREEFINLCIEKKIKYQEAKDCGWPEDFDGVYALGEKETLSDGGEFTPYLRVSDFEKNRQYVRDCGICGYHNDKWIRKRLATL